MESLVSTFHIDWHIIIAQLVNFVVVFVVLYLFALKPLKKLMDERSDKISKGVSDAKENAVIVEKTKKEYAEIVARAKAEANDLFQKGKQETEAKRLEMLESAKSEVNLLILNGRKSLENEKAKIVEEAKKEVVALAVAATEKILADKENLSNIK